MVFGLRVRHDMVRYYTSQHTYRQFAFLLAQIIYLDLLSILEREDLRGKKTIIRRGSPPLPFFFFFFFFFSFPSGYIQVPLVVIVAVVGFIYVEDGDSSMSSSIILMPSFDRMMGVP